MTVLVEDGPGVEVAVVVGERLLELDRERVGKELDHGLARGEIDREVVPFGSRDLGDASVHERLAGRDELDDGGMACVEVLLDGADKGGAFHACQQVPEEALLGALEGGERGGLGALVERILVLDDAGGFQRLVDVGVDDLEGLGIAVVDAPLRGGEGVVEDVDLDALVGQRAGLVEAEGLQVAGDDFHGGDASGLHGGDEVGAPVEGVVVGGPEAEPGCVGEPGNGGGSGGGDIEDAGVREGVLEAQPGGGPAGSLSSRGARSSCRRRWPWRALRRRRSRRRTRGGGVPAGSRRAIRRSGRGATACLRARRERSVA